MECKYCSCSCLCVCVWRICFWHFRFFSTCLFFKNIFLCTYYKRVPVYAEIPFHQLYFLCILFSIVFRYEWTIGLEKKNVKIFSLSLFHFCHKYIPSHTYTQTQSETRGTQGWIGELPKKWLKCEKKGIIITITKKNEEEEEQRKENKNEMNTRV